MLPSRELSYGEKLMRSYMDILARKVDKGVISDEKYDKLYDKLLDWKLDEIT